MNRADLIASAQSRFDGVQNVTTTDILEFIAKSQGIDQVNADTAPTAQSYILCQEVKELTNAFLSAVSNLLQAEASNRVLCAICELQLMNGLRVSEVLHITQSDITDTGLVKIQSLKGSGVRFVRSISYSDVFAKVRAGECFIDNRFNRYFIYRLYKKHGISFRFANHKNSSVTHLARHVLASDIANAYSNVRDAKVYMSHKNVNSTNHYIHEQE